jgi:hypothetical protein
MIKPDLEDLLNIDRYWCCEKCEAPFVTKELAEKHELRCYVLEDIKENVDNLEKILDKTELNSNELRKTLDPFQNINIIGSSADEIKSLIKTAEEKLSKLEEKEEREDTRLGKLEKVKQREKALDFKAAIEIWEELGEISEAARVRKLKAELGSVKLSQKVEIKDSVLHRSNISSEGKSKAEEIKEIKELHDTGTIDDGEFKQMKKEILGK